MTDGSGSLGVGQTDRPSFGFGRSSAGPSCSPAPFVSRRHRGWCPFSGSAGARSRGAPSPGGSGPLTQEARRGRARRCPAGRQTPPRGACSVDAQPRTCPEAHCPPQKGRGPSGCASWRARGTAVPPPCPQRPPLPRMALSSGPGRRHRPPLLPVPWCFCLSDGSKAYPPPPQAVGLGAELGCRGPRHGKCSFLAPSPVSPLPGVGSTAGGNCWCRF